MTAERIAYCCRRCEDLVHAGDPQFENLLCENCQKEEEEDEE